jgi:predicted amidohydrolase YtcJ
MHSILLMRRTVLPGSVALAVVIGALLPGAAAQAQPAGVVVVNAKIYTVNPQQPWAEALAIRDAKILAVGSTREINRYRGPLTRIIDAQGRLVLPGFTDCHIHFMEGSLGLLHVDLNGADTVREIQKRVSAYAIAHSHEWILGMGWNYPVFAPSGMPDRRILDEVVLNRPVFLEAYDGHTAWANSKALAVAGITRATPDPPNGKIVRDEQGEATGALLEEAGGMVSKFAPKPSRDERLAALRKGLHEANRVGLVRVHSAGGDFEWLDLYDELRRKGELTVRQYIAYFLNPPDLTPAAIEQVEQARHTYRDDWIAAGAVKTMLDGVVEAHTAAMLTPYSDDPTKSGKLFWDPAKYKEAIVNWTAAAFRSSRTLSATAPCGWRWTLMKKRRRRTTPTTQGPVSSISRPSRRRTSRASAAWARLPVSSRCTRIRTTTR